ncbi:hypothetical protein D3C85_1529930 [compost metagenome]
MLHPGLIDPPILASWGTDHVQVLLRQHGSNVHASGVVPDEERFVGFFRVVAVEEVDEVR